MKLTRILAAASAIVALASSAALALPTGQIWIPSPDAKGFGETTLNVISVQRFAPKSEAGPSTYDIGAIVGVSPLESLKLEIGIDYITTNLQNDNAYDNHPIYFNAKLATPEGAFGIKQLPAFAVGGFNISTVDSNLTQQNIVYGLVAKTFPVIGRLSVGGYSGDKDVLSVGGSTKTNTGVLASWDRSMPEISDKLWFAVDYMSGKNANGELSVGGSWAFSKQISLIVGAVFFNPFQDEKLGGKPTLTTQIDISLP